MTKPLLLVALLTLFVSAHSNSQTNSDVSDLKQLIAKNAAALHFSRSDLQNYRVSSDYYDEAMNATLVYLQQTWKGIDIYNAITVAAFKNNNLVSVQSSRIDEPEIKAKNISDKPSIDAATALPIALANINISAHHLKLIEHSTDGQEFIFDKSDIALNNISVRLMWTPVDDDQRLALTWQVSLITLGANDNWLVNVNASHGGVLLRENLTANCIDPDVLYRHRIYCYEVESFNVNVEDYTSSENIGASSKDVEKVHSAKFNVIPYPYQDADHDPVLVTDPWTINGTNKAYPKKWNSDSLNDYTDKLNGNNVYAYEDTAGLDQTGYSPPSQTILPNLAWNYPLDLDKEPYENPAFRIVNLFYWTNLMHDLSYNYGFTEKNGNMQTSNFGRGGEGNDQVLAEAMDKYTNFAAAVDGQKSRMQIAVFGPSPFDLLKFKSPPKFKGNKPSVEGLVSDSNRLTKIGKISAPVVIYRDSLDADSSEACSIAANADELKGKIAYVDRGDCPFLTKYQNAQAAGAIGIIVGNVAPDDSRYDGTNTGNYLIIMVATPFDNTVVVPGTFIQYDTAVKLKNYIRKGIQSQAVMTPTPHIDGDLDNTLITHEYTHGISNRLTGGANTVSCLSNGEEPGEGWSDYFALMMLTNWERATLSDSSEPRAIGNYVSNREKGLGFGRHPYSKDFVIDPWTYDSLRTDASILEYDVNPNSVFYTGEVWCSALWDMTWNLIKTEGFNRTFFDSKVIGGNTTAMQLVMAGMKLQKCSPGCIDARNAILEADTLIYNGIHGTEIWTAFARRGMGYSAKQKSNQLIKDGIGAYDLPPGLTEQNNRDAVVSAIQNANVKPVVRITPNPATDQVTINVAGNNTRLNIRLLSNDGAVLGDYSLNGESISIDLSRLAAGVYNIMITGKNVLSRYRLVIN